MHRAVRRACACPRRRTCAVCHQTDGASARDLRPLTNFYRKQDVKARFQPAGYQLIHFAVGIDQGKRYAVFLVEGDQLFVVFVVDLSVDDGGEQRTVGAAAIFKEIDKIEFCHLQHGLHQRHEVIRKLCNDVLQQDSAPGRFGSR